MPKWLAVVCKIVFIQHHVLTTTRYTCTNQPPTFFGCCTSNPCNGVGCPSADLRAAGMGVGTDPGITNYTSYWPNVQCQQGEWYNFLELLCFSESDLIPIIWQRSDTIKKSTQICVREGQWSNERWKVMSIVHWKRRTPSAQNLNARSCSTQWWGQMHSSPFPLPAPTKHQNSFDK